MRQHAVVAADPATTFAAAGALDLLTVTVSDGRTRRGPNAMA